MTYTSTMRPSKKFILTLAVFLLMITNSLSAADTAKAEQQRQAFITKAKEYIGVPYVTGGTDRTGFDCSGLVFTVGKEALNMDLPRTAAQLYDYVKIVADSKKEAGDLLFFKTVGDKISHVAIYMEMTSSSIRQLTAPIPVSSFHHCAKVTGARHILP